MKKIKKHSIVLGLAIAFVLGLAGVSLTASRASAAQPTVDLKTAAPFAILAGTPNITDSPTSTITGNVGLSPASGAGIGLTCAQVTGTIYSVNGSGPLPCRVTDPALLTIAKTDLTAAFVDAAGRTPVTTVPTELGGTTKTAGVYDSGSTTFQITAGAGPLVIDAQGDASAVFIFEMNAAGTGLTVGPGSTVSLINGAQACNIFWRLETATIATTAVFKGNILALTSINVANGANIEGRLLARNGNVTLINDTIAVPTCTTTTTTTTGGGSGTAAPGLPNTGISPENKGNTLGYIILSVFGVTGTLLTFYIVRKKRAI